MSHLDGCEDNECEEQEPVAPGWDSELSELSSSEDSLASTSDEEGGSPTHPPPPRLTIRIPPRTGRRSCTRCMRLVPGVHRWKWCDQCRDLFRGYRQVRVGKLKAGKVDERDQASVGEPLDNEQSEIRVKKRKKRGTPVSKYPHASAPLLILSSQLSVPVHIAPPFRHLDELLERLRNRLLDFERTQAQYFFFKPACTDKGAPPLLDNITTDDEIKDPLLNPGVEEGPLSAEDVKAALPRRTTFFSFAGEFSTVVAESDDASYQKLKLEEALEKLKKSMGITLKDKARSEIPKDIRGIEGRWEGPHSVLVPRALEGSNLVCEKRQEGPFARVKGLHNLSKDALMADVGSVSAHAEEESAVIEKGKNPSTVSEVQQMDVDNLNCTSDVQPLPDASCAIDSNTGSSEQAASRTSDETLDLATVKMVTKQMRAIVDVAVMPDDSHYYFRGQRTLVRFTLTG
jgi:hypothetical protein